MARACTSQHQTLNGTIQTCKNLNKFFCFKKHVNVTAACVNPQPQKMQTTARLCLLFLLVIAAVHAQVSSTPAYLTVFQDRLFFFAKINSAYRIYSTRGNATTTSIFATVDTDVYAIYNANNLYLLVQVANTLYVSNGTSPLTKLTPDNVVMAFPPVPFVYYPVSSQKLMLMSIKQDGNTPYTWFTAGNMAATGLELYRTNGTTVELIRDIDFGTPSSTPQFVAKNVSFYIVLETF